MSPAQPPTSAAPAPRHGRMALVLWALGLPGVAALLASLWQPLQQGAGLLPVPVWVVLASSGVQTAALLALAAWLGARLGPDVGLRSPLLAAWVLRTPLHGAWRSPLRAGVVGGVGAALWLVLLAAWAPAPLAQDAAAQAVPLSVRLLYGGITEEILLRWGLMTLLVWLGWRWLQRRRSAPAGWVLGLAIVLSALAFAAGHLPAAHALAGGLSLPVVAYVLLGNAVFGLLAGALYARWGLESAMLAHALAHLLAWGVAALR